MVTASPPCAVPLTTPWFTAPSNHRLSDVDPRALHGVSSFDRGTRDMMRQRPIGLIVVPILIFAGCFVVLADAAPGSFIFACNRFHAGSDWRRRQDAAAATVAWVEQPPEYTLQNPFRTRLLAVDHLCLKLVSFQRISSRPTEEGWWNRRQESTW
jgi:hypothetical protein